VARFSARRSRSKDVPARMVVVGNPARVLRAVNDDELLENA
jgi:acetyltransferase-like isoleucine patch superfamily enzyme